MLISPLGTHLLNELKLGLIKLFKTADIFDFDKQIYAKLNVNITV
jgi:hypothetical protein